MLKRVTGLAVAVFGVVGILAGPAAAQQYPPADNGISVSDTTPTPGQTVTVTARTFSPGADVTLTLGTDPVTLGNGPAGADGVLQTDVTIPQDTTLGEHTITASGQAPDGTLTLTARITVVSADGSDAGGAVVGGGAASDDSSGGGLPVTGSGLTALLLQIAVALAAAGGLFLARSAKRRRAAGLAG